MASFEYRKFNANAKSISLPFLSNFGSSFQFGYNILANCCVIVDPPPAHRPEAINCFAILAREIGSTPGW